VGVRDVLLLTHDLDIRVIHAATGELLRELILVPARTTSPPADHPAGEDAVRAALAARRG
jgi:hypothetical protein